MELCKAIIKSTGKQCIFKAIDKELCKIHLDKLHKTNEMNKISKKSFKSSLTIKRETITQRQGEILKSLELDTALELETALKIAEVPKELLKVSKEPTPAVSHCSQVYQYGVDKLKEHGLNDWTFEWDRALSRFGSCHHSQKKITVSLKLVKINSFEDCKDTILHEIAHALAGYREGHGPYWKQICIKIGAKPERCYDSDKIKAVESKYTEYCSNCDYTCPRHRKSPATARPKACYYCCKKYNNCKFSKKFLLKLRQNF